MLGPSLRAGRLSQGSVTYNLGSGTGHSVLEVIAAVEAMSGLKVPVRFGARRDGDPAILVATAAKIRAEAGWQPRFTTLAEIVKTAFDWRKAHPGGYGDRSAAMAGTAPIAGIAR